MNNYESRARKRGQNLLIVEGKHEKYEFFWLIFKCFPEMNIDIDSIWIYETNIYMLYEDIVNEYQSGWAERGDDVDLPFVISKKKRLESICYKTDFTNVILVFDYERHDPGFSERKIRDMQKYFIDETDMGKLYINYPMIESYLHLKSLPDIDYANRKIPVSLQPGNEYKALVRKESVIEKLVNFPNRVMDLLEHHWGVQDRKQLMDCYDTVLNVSDLKTVDDELFSAFDGIIEQSKIQTAKFQLKDWIKKMNYAQSGKNTSVLFVAEYNFSLIE